MNRPLVSILIPCHNAAPWLAETLESALAQTWSATEIIVVDDGSRDDSREIASRFTSRGVRLIAQDNAGASAARNAAWRASTGDYLQFLDADDLLHPDKIRVQVERVAGEPAGTVFTGQWGRFTHNAAKAVPDAANPLCANLSPGEYLRRYGASGRMMHPAAWLVPRGVADAAGPWDEQLSLNDDGEYFARVVRHAAKVCHCPEAWSYYRSGLPGSLSRQRSRRHLESAFRALDRIVDQMLAADQGPEMQAAAADLCQRFAYDYFPAATDLVSRAEGRARDLGGSRLPPPGGRTFLLLRRLLGWKLARRLQAAAGRHPA